MPKLTAAAIARYKPGPSRREVRDSGSDLILVIQPTGAMSFTMRFRRPGGRLAKLTLGTVDITGKETDAAPEIGGHLSLAAARRLAAEVQRARRMGVDVVADRTLARQTKVVTFGDAAIDFIENYAKQHHRRWQGTARLLGLSVEGDRLLITKGGLAARWRNRPITNITGRDVADVLREPLDRGAPHMSNAILAALRKMFNWLGERHRLNASPCDRIRRPTLVEARDRVLTDDEIGRVWAASSKVGGPWAAFLRLLALTGQRRDEVAGMRWTELTDGGASWTIPKERTKNKRAHVVPLSPPAREIINGVPRMEGCPFVFSTNGRSPISGFSKLKVAIDDAAVADGRDPLPAWRFHDLRRTAATGMARLGIALPVIEKVLNHTSGSFAGIVGVYQRHGFADEKRSALDAWATFLTTLVGDTGAVTSCQ